MTAALGAVGLVVGLLVGFLLARALRHGPQAPGSGTDLQGQLDAALERLASLEHDAGHGPTSEGDLPETGPAPVTADAVDGEGCGPEPGAQAVVAALWALARLDLSLQRRRLAIVSTAVDDEGPVGLLSAFDEEVARLREEMGVPGSFHHRIDGEPAAGPSLLALHAARATLDQLARRSQGYDLTVLEADGVLTVTVVCDAFDGDRDTDPDLEAVAAALAPAGGDLAVDEDGSGRLRVEVRVPTGP